jgi:cell division protein FtsW (lipid II flippase)
MNAAKSSPITALLLWLIPFLLFVCVPFFGMDLGKALAWSLILLLIAALSDPIGRWLIVLFGLSGR